MPYFRWLGPTAIMPGFKQMVVKVKRENADIARSSTESAFSPGINKPTSADQRVPSMYTPTPAAVESDVRTPLDLPFYDTSPMPPSELITHLAKTFFTHLGCNYPFLQRERFMRDLEEKQVDAILVDAVCALAARFSTHPLLTQQPNDENKPSPADYGHAFAQRAKTALVDTFSCPTAATVQAALLLAYNEFGEQRDSGLWMYLGISIRMAQDLGMHKLQGLKYMGKSGPTPRQVKRESLSGVGALKHPDSSLYQSTESGGDRDDQEDDKKAIEEQKAVEQERVDTFWAVFFLDRVVSSGTGRTSTLRDKDIEISFPPLDETENSGWPAPFPALIRIVHLYGRVADLLNSVKEPSDITSETTKRLGGMESQVTSFYQGLSPRLHFDAVNFQHYMKAGEGTNFVLLHFWFHTLIVMLHQPTLLKTFEGRMLQLFPNSQQLSMSSAKTIADILAYSQLMDAKASLGNPFTSQPIYIAACAFLKETAEQTATSNAQSRANSPTRHNQSRDSNQGGAPLSDGTPQSAAKRHVFLNSSSCQRTPATLTEQKALAKHTLLATAATQHYQLCYKALQSLETYWAGTKYILTVLDQKFEGVGDPLLYTVEEGESSLERPKPEPAFTSPGWRRKLSWGPYMGQPNFGPGISMQSPFFKDKVMHQVPGSPSGDTCKPIGWTLTGTMNSPSTNLAWHFPSANGKNDQLQQPTSGFAPMPDYNANAAMATTNGQDSAQGLAYPQHLHTSSANLHRASSSDQSSRPALPMFTPSRGGVSGIDSSFIFGVGSSPYQPGRPYPAQPTSDAFQSSSNRDLAAGNVADFDPYNGTQNFGDMMIESQDVDMSMLGLESMPWFDSYMYPTHDMMSMFDPGGGGATEVSLGTHAHEDGEQSNTATSR